MKLHQLINAEASIKSLLAIQLPTKISYKLSKVMLRMEPEIKIYHDKRNELIKQLGTPTDPKQDNYQVTSENLAKFQEEVDKLGEIEVDLNFGPGKELEKIKIEDLGEINLPGSDLMYLDWLFEA